MRACFLFFIEQPISFSSNSFQAKAFDTHEQIIKIYPHTSVAHLLTHPLSPPSIPPPSRAFLQMGLGLPGEETTNSSTTPSPAATMKLSTSTFKASIIPNKVPLSEAAQAVLSEAALPDFSYMLAKLPVAPPLTVGSSSSSIEQQSEHKE